VAELGPPEGQDPGRLRGALAGLETRPERGEVRHHQGERRIPGQALLEQQAAPLVRGPIHVSHDFFVTYGLETDLLGGQLAAERGEQARRIGGGRRLRTVEGYGHRGQLSTPQE